MKPLKFVGSSRDDLRNFPDQARRAAGFELYAFKAASIQAIGNRCQQQARVSEKFAFTFLENGELSTSQNWLMQFMSFTLSKRKVAKQANKTLKWLVRDTN